MRNGSGVPAVAASVMDERGVEAVVRRYMGRMVMRYLPAAVGAVALLLVVVLLPSTSQFPATSAQGQLNSAASTGSTGASQASGGSPASVSAGGSASTGGLAAAGATGGSSATASSGTATASGPTNSSTRPRSGTVSSGGPDCSGGERQVAWSKYSPLCVVPFRGDNGGATAPGVTAKTITITYRKSSSGEAAALSAEEGAAGTSDSGFIADLNTYIKLFNKDYELYGRQVVLRPYQGQGDWVQEEQGQDLAAAQADAVTAKDLGAFGDLSLNSVTQPYSQDLAQEHVIAFGAVFMPQSWFETYAPYEYSVVPTGTQWSHLWANTVCTRMAGLPAVFSGNMTGQSRKFGLLVGDAPTYNEDGNELQAQLKSQCGVGLARRAAYSINFADYTQQAVSIVAQMKAAGVTTFICGCDPIMMAALASASDQQSYYPEWLTVYWGDPAGRLSASDQWSHALVNGGAAPSARLTEAYRAFQLADPGGTPAEQYYPAPYEALLQIFAALQAAGPDLTPQSYQRAMFSLPPSLPGGDYGDWAFGPGSYTAGIDTHLGWWSNTAISNYDGSKGAWQNCENGKLFRYDVTSDYGTPHTQPHCFGR